MRRQPAPVWLLVLGFLVAAVLPAAGASGEQPSVRNAQIQTRSAAAGLEKEFKALLAGHSEPAWVGYAVALISGRHQMCCYDSWDGWSTGCCGGCRLEGSKNTSMNINSGEGPGQAGLVWLEGPSHFFVLFRIAQKRVDKIRSYSEDCELDAGGLPFIWLMDVRPAESVALLSAFVTAADIESDRDDHIAQSALAAIALHADPAADRAFEGFVAGSQPEALRGKAAFWLGAARGKPGFALLRRMAREDASDRVREKVTFALSVSHEPEAIDEMIRMARNDSSVRVRGQSLFWLAQKAGKKAVGAITAAIENDPETEVKKRAVFALSQLPKDEGVPMLIQVARTNRNPALTRHLASQLFQVAPTDPATFAGVSLLMGAVVLAATYIPTRRVSGQGLICVILPVLAPASLPHGVHMSDLLPKAMNRILAVILSLGISLPVPAAARAQRKASANEPSSSPAMPQAPERRYLIEQVGPVALVQFYADGFDKLTQKQRLLAYYLAEAGIAGDPIYCDQISPYGLELKQLLEGIWTHPQGIEPAALEKIRRYTKLFWVYHGNYDLDSSRKFLPEFTPAELRAAAQKALRNGANFGAGAKTEKALDAKLKRLEQPIFDPNFRPVLTVKNPPPGQDIVTASGNNLYENVTLAEVESLKGTHGLNSRVVKRGGKVMEEIWRAGTPGRKVPPGRYAAYIRRIMANLEKAAEVAEPAQADVLRKLIRFYETGEKSDWYAYNIAWVKNAATVDAINGFIEQYLDPRSEKGAYESVVSFVDADQSALMRDFAANAQYFENRAPWKDEFKKENVSPPVANVITVLSEAGETGPISPAGINLPNEQDIRQQYGSKSVLLFNVSGAFAAATGEKASKEFSATEEEKERARKYRQRARNLLVAMHEVIGHGSGKVSARLTGDPRAYLKEYYSALEEARADLVALWDFADPKLTAMGIADQEELMKAAYDNYARQALVLLYRYPQGDQVEESHDRGTQMIVQYLINRFGCIEPVTQDGKIYLRVSDSQKMHEGVGELLAELMRIKAEGDYAAIKKLMDTYGVKLNSAWRDQVVERARRIGLPTRVAFISPLVEPVRDAEGKIVDARIQHTQDFPAVMLTYSRESLGYLPSK